MEIYDISIPVHLFYSLKSFYSIRAPTNVIKKKTDLLFCNTVLTFSTELNMEIIDKTNRCFSKRKKKLLLHILSYLSAGRRQKKINVRIRCNPSDGGDRDFVETKMNGGNDY